MDKGKKRKKKKNFHSYTFAISDKERKVYEKFCCSENISFNRLIKLSLRHYAKTCILSKDEDVSQNQLNLFSPLAPIQTHLPF